MWRLQKLKKYFSLFLVTVLLLTTGFGCKGLSAEQQMATRAVALEYWTVYDDVDVMRGLAEKFKASHPNVTINIKQLRPEELYTRLVEALAEDKSPDIVSVNNRWMKKFQSKLSPMPFSVSDTTTQVIKKAVGTENVINTRTFNLPSPTQLDKEFVQTVKKDVFINSETYGLPLSLDTMALYYNKDLLDRAGIPEPPKDWTAFQEAVKKLNKYNKNTGTIIQSGTALGTAKNIPVFDDVLYILLKQSGIDIIDKNNNVTLNTVPKDLPRDQLSPTFSVLNFYTDYADPTRDTYSWNEEMEDALDRFTRGSLGFFFGYSYHYKTIKARSPQLNFSALPMLQLNEEAPVNSANYWIQAVPSKAKNPNESWNFIRYLAYSDANKEYLDATKRPTALRAYISGQSQSDELGPFVAQALTADNWYRGRNYESAVKALEDLVGEWMKVPADPNKIIEFRQKALNNTAEKIRQTL